MSANAAHCAARSQDPVYPLHRTEGPPDDERRPAANGAASKSFGGDVLIVSAARDAVQAPCRRCRHPLTRSVSVARGFGPTCWRMVLDAARAGGVL